MVFVVASYLLVAVVLLSTAVFYLLRGRFLARRLEMTASEADGVMK